MNRRTFIASLLAGGAVAVGGTWFAIEPSTKPLTIAQALNDIAELKNGKYKAIGDWDLAQVLTHCAQSIEYSMTNYPEHKSDMFKSTIGSVAFATFAAKGKMMHNLAEQIPGAPPVEPNGVLDIAFERLVKAFSDFNDFNGDLKPHFAYGELTKTEYEMAHVMHLNNHLKEIVSLTT